jgi:hypothetical protein
MQSSPSGSNDSVVYGRTSINVDDDSTTAVEVFPNQVGTHATLTHVDYQDRSEEAKGRCVMMKLCTNQGKARPLFCCISPFEQLGKTTL